MKLVITPAAASDLGELTSYLIKRSPSGLAKVLNVLETNMQAIADGHLNGRKSFRDDVREVVDTEYGYLLPFFIEGDRAYILRVYHSSRKGLNAKDIEDSLKTRNDDIS